MKWEAIEPERGRVRVRARRRHRRPRPRGEAEDPRPHARLALPAARLGAQARPARSRGGDARAHRRRRRPLQGRRRRLGRRQRADLRPRRAAPVGVRAPARRGLHRARLPPRPPRRSRRQALPQRDRRRGDQREVQPPLRDRLARSSATACRSTASAFRCTPTSTGLPGDFVANMQRFAALGLDIAITEADVGAAAAAERGRTSSARRGSTSRSSARCLTVSCAVADVLGLHRQPLVDLRDAARHGRRDAARPTSSRPSRRSARCSARSAAEGALAAVPADGHNRRVAYRYLFEQLVRRELRQKYKGSALGRAVVPHQPARADGRLLPHVRGDLQARRRSPRLPAVSHGRARRVDLLQPVGAAARRRRCSSRARSCARRAFRARRSPARS